MKYNYVFSNADTALPVLMDELLHWGDEFGSRAGATKELMHVGITLTEPWQRELTLPSRKANIAAQIAETMWVLAGRNDVEWLGRYLPRAADFSDDGQVWRAGYGPRLRNWSHNKFAGVDQLAYVIDTLRASSGSRQAVATLWDPEVDTVPGKDIACNNWLSFSSRKGKLDLHVAIRSNDAMWGWSGINAFEWSALQEIVAGLLSLCVGELHFSTTSFHLYEQHWAKARSLVIETGAWGKDSPRFDATGFDDVASLDYCFDEWFLLEEQIRYGTSNPNDIDNFPEPMMRSWLRVLQWWWSGNLTHLEELRGTRLYAAAQLGMQPVNNKPAPTSPPKPMFVEAVAQLHAEKHAAYGDSWKRRGEYMIMANIARKVDRLEGGTDTPDETQTDTAIDLLVYLAKYHAWLEGQAGDPLDVECLLVALHNQHQTGLHDIDTDRLVKSLLRGFATLEQQGFQDAKLVQVRELLPQAFCLAWTRWSA